MYVKFMLVYETYIHLISECKATINLKNLYIFFIITLLLAEYKKLK